MSTAGIVLACIASALAGGVATVVFCALVCSSAEAPEYPEVPR